MFDKIKSIFKGETKEEHKAPKGMAKIIDMHEVEQFPLKKELL